MNCDSLKGITYTALYVKITRKIAYRRVIRESNVINNARTKPIPSILPRLTRLTNCGSLKGTLALECEAAGLEQRPLAPILVTEFLFNSRLFYSVRFESHIVRLSILVARLVSG